MKRLHRTKIVIGTRGSELARRQTSVVVEGLQTRWADLKIEMTVIQTRGDQRKNRIVDVRAGRKGLFTGEIERALITRDIDLAVHSAKDLPSALTPETEIAAVLPREIFLPAGGQGVIAIQTRSDDERLKEIVKPMNDFDTRLCLRAEREFLRLLNADCNQPVGVLAIVDGTIMKMSGQVFDLEATTPRKGS